MENQTQRPLPNGTAVLVLGIVSIVGCFCDGIPGLVCGIIALVLASKDLKLYNADPTLYTPGSLSNLKSGRVCAIVGLSLSAIVLVIVLIELFIFGAAILTHPYELFNQHTSVSM
ncbi:MAG TPA: CCC motif membrane protein [Puia sp.]|jgi:hypothetical protein|nr:CCC motif membrane protein [Puia sp.]